MYFLDNNPSENRTKFTKLKVACKYASIGGCCASRWFTVCCEFLLRKKNCFSPWDFAFRTALSGLCAEISIESKWVYSHIKLSSYFNHRVTNAKTQFDMAVNPLWFNINHKTMALSCCNGWCVLILECHFPEVLFFMNNLDKTTVDQDTVQGVWSVTLNRPNLFFHRYLKANFWKFLSKCRLKETDFIKKTRFYLVVSNKTRTFALT